MNLFQPFLLLLLTLLLLFSILCRGWDYNLSGFDRIVVAYTIIVDKSGHGKFTNIQSAINSIPAHSTRWIRIQIFPGIYREKVTIPLDKPYIFLDGSGIRSTIIKWGDHQSTNTSCTFLSYAENILAKGITFKNTYNLQNSAQIAPAVAAAIVGDKSAFYQCSFVGVQDTLWDATGRHYFNKCYIEGAIDFIFGSGQSIYEQCMINLSMKRLPPQYTYGYITAQGRNSARDTSGFVFKSCTITGTGKAYLGRAYGAYSRVIIANSMLSNIIEPQGWSDWDKQEKNIEYAEAGCKGSGADTSKRVPFEKKISPAELKRFVDISYIDREGWIPKLTKLFS